MIEPQYINQLPSVRNRLNVTIKGKIGTTPQELRREYTHTHIEGNSVTIYVGDSREGWVESYKTLLELSTDERFSTEVEVVVDLSDVRQSGETLKGFGGVANPVKLPVLYQRCASILNEATGRQLNSVECCLLIDEAAVTIVAGNIRRSAGMRQFQAEDKLGSTAKDNLWQQDENGNWRIDPERDALRMANHTRVFHRKPTLEECVEAVRKQYYSGEGAIQWAGEAVARANCDLVNTPELKKEFLQAYEQGKAQEWIQKLDPNINAQEIEHRLARYGLNPCGEIIGSNFHCNLSEIHLNQIDPHNYKEQEEAFTAGALSVAALLNHKFLEPRYQQSRELDPIVGVSFTGLFDFFVHAFGVDWLSWWAEGRPATPQGLAFKEQEKKYLTFWKDTVHRVVWDYCDRHHLKRPNRCTTVQPSGTKSLLTGASSGWHPPKAQRFIRRITFGKNDPVALACIDYGYSVIPSQSDKDEQGNLLNDPFDPRVSEWLVEIPVAVSWADLPGADEIDVSQFSVSAQFDFVLQVQRWYVTHNTSATLELRSEEIETLAQGIYDSIQNDQGYISAALLARFDDLQSFPRLPFEPIDKLTYQRLNLEVKTRRKTDDFCAALSRYDSGELTEAGPSGCDSDKCMFPDQAPMS
ncbi:ribonucleoside-triphosphate reductase, adenosylcobalamin-dependent [Umezakia ovalisporum]|uniref:Ribonucleoside-triphosphate reductase, adenosylcobalamin-dependent n=1 Tax=Umezakia ovalisporum FSS-62 TaxID=2971776 RepID=A0AA43H1Q3_9CYAN|nr:ribonucleoside-triphosphate reductase, adenosylcobalamin-dependent [Umezakia ovalisporum]MBI1240230.1 ribonucleoside-triphosphate reductase, adenosylcobalamin-dependent [Nostoc sp. RI_552]MDH6065543.1 ribonucleoside-triphosphate reductase, adenosylcobalamin-dependent [Umezakia ovalisporum FSS-62]MDH6068759.1 ribonucleoside-triphosphate reductase, adenosylcobalamin-dependent [Umezakia ovalisporum APH033B]MDH6073361.1 ribonucleoside-triphosphate reductase, adenosylcobalamin-dependent [Umezakia